MRILFREARHLGSRNEGDARRKREQYTESDKKERTAGLIGHDFQRKHPEDKTRDRTLQQESNVTGMNLLVRKIKRGGNQAEHSGKNKCGANGFRGGKPGDEEQSWDGETAAADAGQADGERNDKANEQMGHCERSEKV